MNVSKKKTLICYHLCVMSYATMNPRGASCIQVFPPLHSSHPPEVPSS